MEGMWWVGAVSPSHSTSAVRGPFFLYISSIIFSKHERNCDSLLSFVKGHHIFSSHFLHAEENYGSFTTSRLSGDVISTQNTVVHLEGRL